VAAGVAVGVTELRAGVLVCTGVELVPAVASVSVGVVLAERVGVGEVIGG
jgi:hypothetical protein